LRRKSRSPFFFAKPFLPLLYHFGNFSGHFCSGR